MNEELERKLSSSAETQEEAESIIDLFPGVEMSADEDYVLPDEDDEVEEAEGADEPEKPVYESHVVANRAERNSKHGKKKKKKPMSALGIAAIAFVFLAVVFVFLVGSRVDEETGKTVTIAQYVVSEFSNKTFMGNAEERLSRDMVPISVDEDSPLYEKFKSADRVNVLLLGINGNMTDTIMLGSYDMVNQRVDIISIPRDTYYYRSAYGKYTAYQKINSIFGKDHDVVSLATAVSDLLHGMPIHYYLVVEYDDIKAVMKTIDGVEINVPFHMRYDDTTPGEELHINIPAGPQIIDQSNVIEFLRFRHTNPSYAAQGYKSYAAGDIQRIQVQQEFVKAVIKKCCKAGNILDVVQVVLDNVDSDLTYGMAIKVATKILSGFSTENMESYTLPGTDFTNELSFWRCDSDKTYELIEQIYGVTVEEEQEIIYVEPGSRIRFVGVPEYAEEDE